MVKAPLPPDKNDARAPDRRNNWLVSPQLWAVIGGLAGTVIGAAITGFFNITLEQQKFQSDLIQKALVPEDKNEKANGLIFLAQAGLIPYYKDNIIQSALPTILGGAIRDHFITIYEVKNVLIHVGMHQGPLNDVADETFRKEIVEFQMSRGLPPDGYVGPNTYAKLREAWPEHFINNFITVREAQSVLIHLQLYSGPLNDEADEGFRKAVVEFQKANGIEQDEYMGNPLTYKKLKEVWPEHFREK